MSPDPENRSGRPSKSGREKLGKGKKDPRYIALRPGALAVTQLPAYSFEVEQYRNLSLQIEERFDPEDNGSHVLAIAGPDPSSGKTLTSLNLALIFSRRSERKVLLVEGDLWKPSFGSVFQLQAETIGMSELLRDDKLQLDDALYSVWGTALSVLTAGQKKGEGDLVTSRRMDELVVAMKSRFDLVVFDTPPFGLASGRYLTRYADSVLVVVRAGKTHRKSIEATLEGLEPETVVGLVLNDVRKRKRNYAYYSSYTAYYGGEYGGKPRGWSKGFWRRPLAGLAAVTTVFGAVAASVFAILRGKPAEAEIEPAWIVAGILLILTLTSWAVAIGMRQPLQDQRESMAVTEVAGSAATSTDLAPLREEDPTVVAMPDRSRSDPDELESDDSSSNADDVTETDANPTVADRGITITNLNIRKQPALDGEYLATLPRGTPFELLERADDWYLVRADTRVGWVAKLGTELSPASDVAQAPRAATNLRAVEGPKTLLNETRTNTNLNLRAEPGRDGRYLTTLPEGTPVEVLEESGDWSRVRSGDQSGWVFNDGLDGASISPVDEEPSVPVAPSAEPSTPTDRLAAAPSGEFRTNTNLNLRARPGREGRYLTTLPEGTPVEILEESDDWYRVRAGDQSGWVFKPGVDGVSPSSGDDAAGPAAGASATEGRPQVSWVPPKFLSWRPPSYQTTADSKGVGETLVAAVQVTATGSVRSVTLAEESKTDAAFNAAVLQSLRAASFRPAFRNGVAVASEHQVRVKYRESSMDRS